MDSVSRCDASGSSKKFIKPAGQKWTVCPRYFFKFFKNWDSVEIGPILAFFAVRSILNRHKNVYLENSVWKTDNTIVSSET